MNERFRQNKSGRNKMLAVKNTVCGVYMPALCLPLQKTDKNLIVCRYFSEIELPCLYCLPKIHQKKRENYEQ